MKTTWEAIPPLKYNILVVDDDPAVRRSLQLLLQGSGYEVRSFASGKTLLTDDKVISADCLITDYRMDECDGLDTLAQMRMKGWSGHAILISGFWSMSLVHTASEAGFEAVLEKPLRQHALTKALERLLPHIDAADANQTQPFKAPS
jgi:FixJ family two-component response regulator